MLVSSIARFKAAESMNNAAYSMINTTNTMNNAVSNLNTFGGEQDLNLLHQMDKKLSLDLASNSLLYKLSCLQQKAAQKRQEQEIKQFFDILA